MQRYRPDLNTAKVGEDPEYQPSELQADFCQCPCKESVGTRRQEETWH